MVEYIYCICGKPIDEYESKCYWCGTIKPKDIEEKNEKKERQLVLFEI